MVYCGKPSGSCAECRLRRTKCDRLKPACSQCIRAGRVCKGYRDPGALIFRDESKGLVAKSQQKPPKRQGAANSIPNGAPHGQNRIGFPIQAQPFLDASIPLGLNLSIEDQATSFFFQNYIPDRQFFPTGGFQYLEDIYKREKIRDVVLECIISLGLAGLSNFWKTPSFMVKANSKYASALRLLSSQLINIKDAKADQTFAAVMLLGFYETITCRSRKSLDAWTKHTLGSSAIMKLRGKRQLQTQVGHDLYIHHRSQVVSNCMQTYTFVPEFIMEWNNDLATEAPTQAAYTELCNLYVKFANFRAAMGFKEDYSTPEATIAHCCALDIECVKWAQACPVQYIYRKVRVKTPSEEVYNGYYDVYSNLWIANIWNTYRTLRICIQEMAIKQLKYFYRMNPTKVLFNDPGFYARQKMECENSIIQCSQDICASVPGFLGFNPDPTATRPLLRAFDGNLLLWPLYNAGRTTSISAHQRGWVIGRLRFLVDVLSIRHAKPMIYSLESTVDMAEWDGDTDPNLPEEITSIILSSDQVSQHTTREQEGRQQDMISQNLVLHTQSLEYEDPGYENLQHFSIYPEPSAQAEVYSLPSHMSTIQSASAFDTSLYDASAYDLLPSAPQQLILATQKIAVDENFFENHW